MKATGNGRPAPADLFGPATIIAPQTQRSRLGPFEVVWQFWKDYAEKIAHYQTMVLLTVIYYVIAGPTALIGRLVGHDFLPHLPSSAPSFWYPSDMGRPKDNQDYLHQF